MGALRAGLVFAAFYYPLWWTVQSLLNIAPALARWATGSELQAWTIRPGGAFVRVEGSWDPLWAHLVLAGLGAAAARKAGQWARFAFAVLGMALAFFWTSFALRRGLPPAVRETAGLLLALAVLTAALRWLRLSLPALLVGLVLPAALLPWLLYGPGPPARVALISLIPVAIALALSRISPPVVTLPAVTWKAAAAGLAVTLAINGATRWAEQERRRQDEAERRQVLASLPKPSPHEPFPKLFFQRGVSFTAEAAVGYASAQARSMLAQLPGYGVNAVALVPYGFSRGNPLRIGPAGPGSWESDDGVEILSALAHQQGMKVLLKPHVWRVREADLSSPEQRAEWFRQYTSFIEHYARLATRIHADLFAVGTEFGWLTRHEAEWRRIIARVRDLYPGPLTYASNHGPEFESIRFWDALDYIGVDNYYPLPDDYSTGDLVRRIEQVQARFQKPVLFTEAGFSAVLHANRAPWEDETDKPLSLETQARSYQALFEAFYQKPWFYGVYWWKVGTNGYGGPANNSMTPWRKPAMEVVRRFYTSGMR